MNPEKRQPLTRREMITRSAALTAGVWGGGLFAAGCSRESDQRSSGSASAVVQNGRIKQVLASRQTAF